MKLALAAILAIATAAPAFATITCTTYGNITRCRDSQTGETLTCTTYGAIRRCY